MAPPSIIEFYLSYVVRLSIAAACGHNNLQRHLTDKGCAFDFSSELSKSRYSVMTGFVCLACSEKIISYCSKEFFEDANLLLKKEWLGTMSNPSDISLTSKKLGYDLFHTKGLIPTFGEKVYSKLREESVIVIVKSIVSIPAIILGFLIGYLK